VGVVYVEVENVFVIIITCTFVVACASDIARFWGALV